MAMTIKEAERVVDAVEELAKATFFLQRYPPGHVHRENAEKLRDVAREELNEALRVGP